MPRPGDGGKKQEEKGSGTWPRPRPKIDIYPGSERQKKTRHPSVTRDSGNQRREPAVASGRRAAAAGQLEVCNDCTATSSICLHQDRQLQVWPRPLCHAVTRYKVMFVHCTGKSENSEQNDCLTCIDSTSTCNFSGKY